jgi:D-amino peptidase
MNVFISADIEGVCGVMGTLHWSPGGSHYRLACEWMVKEVNAAVEGALEAGAERIVVKDAHNDGTNIELDKLHPAAELISGWGPLNSMVEGIDSSFHVLFLIGYHARGATADGTLAHTWSGNVLDLQVNGRTIGETGWAAAFAGHFDVPVGLVTGDDKLIAQLKQELPDGYQTVITKTGWAYNAARMRPIVSVREDIRAAAARALAEVKALPVFKPAMPVTLTVRFRHWEGLHACAAVPGVERLAVDTFQCRAVDIIEAQKYFSTLHRLARPNT